MSPIDCVFVSLPEPGKKPLEVDIDDQEEIKLIRNIVCDSKHAYILANKHNGHIGFYLLKIELDNPRKRAIFIINWRNKLDIACCDLYHIKFEDRCKLHGLEDECLKNNEGIIVSYKMIGYNTYNVFVIDQENSLLKYWHESYALWESPIRGFLLPNNNYLIISKEGIELLALGHQNPQ